MIETGPDQQKIRHDLRIKVNGSL